MKLSTMKLTMGFLFGLVLALPVVGHAYLYTADDYSDGHDIVGGDKQPYQASNPYGIGFINVINYSISDYSSLPAPTPAASCSSASDGGTAGGRQYINIVGSNFNTNSVNVQCNGVNMPLVYGSQTSGFVQVSFLQTAANASCTATVNGETGCPAVAVAGTAPTFTTTVLACSNGGTPPQCLPPPSPSNSTTNLTTAFNGCYGAQQARINGVCVNVDSFGRPIITTTYQGSVGLVDPDDTLSGAQAALKILVKMAQGSTITSQDRIFLYKGNYLGNSSIVTAIAKLVAEIGAMMPK